MKRKFYSLLSITLFSASVFGQEGTRLLDKGNMREGEHVEYCIQHKKMNELKQDPQMAALIQAAQQQLAYEEQHPKGATQKGTVYTIPVVFHVLHVNGSENISREQLVDAIAILNRDYRLQNADAATVQPPFQGMPTDIEIEFKLATIAPNGQCFSGITRTYTTLTNDGSSGQAQVNAVIAGNDVYQGVWPHTKYLNVYVCKDIGGAAGYTFNPMGGSTASASGMYYNGVFALHNYVGSIGTSSAYTSRTLTHEVGHWLNLEHVWGPNNNPGSGTCGSGDDGVQDTPLCIGSTTCNYTQNTCDDTNDPNGWSSWTTNVVDNVENYMDYSYCSKMFTPNQSTRMRTALTSSTAGRNQIWTSTNLANVGASTTPTLCKALFDVTKTVICAGESLTFTDQSYNNATGWTWTFNGGSPATSSAQNPTVTYNTPGTYTVVLTATDGANSNTLTRTNYITVLPNATTLPFYESFEGLSTITPTYFVDNAAGNGWIVTNTAGNSGTNSAKLSNYNETAGNVDAFSSQAIDLSTINSTTGVTMSFRYAYRKRVSTNNDILKIFASKDCGSTWDIRKTLSATTMSGSSLVTSAYTPASGDWVTVHMTNITSAYWNANFRFKFEFTAGSGNNCYIDDINIYAGPASDVPVTTNGLDEINNLTNINLYPNPTDGDVQIAFNSMNDGNVVTLTVTDLTGKTIQVNTLAANSGNNLVIMNTSTLSAGTYLIRLADQSGAKTLTFVKK